MVFQIYWLWAYLMKGVFPRNASHALNYIFTYSNSVCKLCYQMITTYDWITKSFIKENLTSAENWYNKINQIVIEYVATLTCVVTVSTTSRSNDNNAITSNATSDMLSLVIFNAKYLFFMYVQRHACMLIYAKLTYAPFFLK